MVSADADRLLVWDVASWTVTACALLPRGMSEPWKPPELGASKQRQYQVRRAAFVGTGAAKTKTLVSLECSNDSNTVQCLRVWHVESSSVRACADAHINQVRTPFVRNHAPWL
jgi:hypothetical protein